MYRRLRRTVVTLAAAACVAAAVGAASAGAVTITPVASGLDNPRGMAFGPNGALYVAEAGEGGSDFCFEHPALGPVCGGMSGAVTRLWKGKQERILRGLPSFVNEGGEALGPSDVNPHGNGNLYVTIGLGDNPAVRNTFPAPARLHGWLVKGNPSGHWKPTVDIAAFEAANNPDAGQPGTLVDSNPNAVAALPGGRAVVDAGANDLLSVDASGNISVLAVFPVRFVPFGPGMIPMQPVPTSIAVGPDGALYVGQLTGFPFPMGGANIFRVVPGQQPTVYASGFTNVLGVAFGPDGSLYVAEISHFGLLSGNPAGGIWRVPPGGGTPQLLTTSVILPGGIAVAPDGSLYVSTCAPCTNAGQVVKIVP
jgi:glucose/arabinose dehydrogenase